MSKQKASKYCQPRAKKLIAVNVIQQEIWRSPSNSTKTDLLPYNGEENVSSPDASQPLAVSNAEMTGKDITTIVKELLRLLRSKAILTHNDINETLSDSVISVEQMDEIYIKLRNLEVEIVDAAEVDRVKAPEREEEEEKTRLDILDDPVRMYLKQMGQVPLLTREQEVEISKRVESADQEVKRILYSMGFTGKEHIALAEKLISEPPKERFDRVIQETKMESRSNHLKELQQLIKRVRHLDMAVDESYAKMRVANSQAQRSKLEARFKETRQETAGHV
jgi:RNA polymerase primary sigma factor